MPRFHTAPMVWREFGQQPLDQRVRLESDVAFVAVIDTNVLEEFYSCHDLLNAYESLDHSAPSYRIQRVRETLTLAMHLHVSKAATYSLHNELLEQLLSNAPPLASTIDRKSVIGAFTVEQIYFVKDALLPDWDAQLPTTPETARGNDADGLLIVKAKQFGVPLITNEGFGPSGIRDEKLRKRATKEGVVAMTPGEFCKSRIGDTRELVHDFLARFGQLSPGRIETGPTHRPELLRFMLGYYEHVLLGKPAPYWPIAYTPPWGLA